MTGKQRAWARPLASLLGAPLTQQSPIERADAIVVLGAPVAEEGGVSAVVEERVQVGAELWRRGLAPVVCVTGGGPPGRVEADRMAARLVELGVPERALRIEREARTTEENARNVAALLPRGAAVWIVTQPFHLRRSMLLFRRAGLKPLAWHINGSVQYRDPTRALRWITREYAAYARDSLQRLRRRPGDRRT